MSETFEEICDASGDWYDFVMEQVFADMVELDNWRRNELPAAIKSRYEEDADEIYITKPELVELMEWKLKKGKFRPSLRKLIAENSESAVRDISKEAFVFFIKSIEGELTKDRYLDHMKQSLKIITKLRGVGPATGSLVLSLLVSVTELAPPFLSDESARYMLRRDGVADTYKLKYTVPEYLRYLAVHWDLCSGSRDNYKFNQLEHGSWAIETAATQHLQPGAKRHKKPVIPIT